MAQDLQELRDEVRGLMNDVDADLITDREINKWLNEGLVHLTLKAQMLEDSCQFDTVANQREYPLPFRSGDIKSVWFYTGSRQHELLPRRFEQATEGSRQTSNVITHYYKRLNTANIHTQDSTSAITRNTNGNKGTDQIPMYVVGLFPTPTVAQKVTVYMYIPHPKLRKSRDLVRIPEEFHFGPVAYALFKAYSKEKAYAEARHYSEVWNDIIDQAREWSQSQARVGHGEVIRDFDPFDMQEWPGRAIID